MAGKQYAVVDVPVTGLWTTPESPREVDAAMIADVPDHAAWLAELDKTEYADPNGRGGLGGRFDSELEEGEPVIVLEERDGWTRVEAPWQPHDEGDEGYPGWVRTAHLSPVDELPQAPADTPSVSRQEYIDSARQHIGLKYLWGGITPAGLDCSGLVHHTARALGWVISRDAHVQCDRSECIPPEQAQPGDLYFFAREGKGVHHVGIVTGPMRMVHAPETGATVVEEELNEDRRATLVCAGRILP